MRSIAPVEWLLIGFPGSEFTGGIAPEIARLVADGTVRVLDLVFIAKDTDGNVTSFEYDDNPLTAAFAEIDGDADGFLDEDDIAAAALELDPGSSALLLVWEDLWAARLGAEIVASGGRMLAGRRIPHEVVEELVAYVEGAQS
jgi:hypothetical protein